jgi:hypothetical protein
VAVTVPLGVEGVLEREHLGQDLEVGLEAVGVDQVDTGADLLDHLARHVLVLPAQVDSDLRHALRVDAIGQDFL